MSLFLPNSSVTITSQKLAESTSDATFENGLPRIEILPKA